MSQPDTRHFYTGRRERLQSAAARRELSHQFIEFLMGIETILGADAHRGAFSERTSKVVAGVDPEVRPHMLLNILPTGTEPAEESLRSVMELWANLISQEVPTEPDLPDGPPDPEDDSPPEPEEGW